MRKTVREPGPLTPASCLHQLGLPSGSPFFVRVSGSTRLPAAGPDFVNAEQLFELRAPAAGLAAESAARMVSNY